MGIVTRQTYKRATSTRRSLMKVKRNARRCRQAITNSPLLASVLPTVTSKHDYMKKIDAVQRESFYSTPKKVPVPKDGMNVKEASIVEQCPSATSEICLTSPRCPMDFSRVITVDKFAFALNSEKSQKLEVQDSSHKVPSQKTYRVQFATSNESGECEKYKRTLAASLSQQDRFQNSVNCPGDELWYMPKDYISFKNETKATLIALHEAKGIVSQLDTKLFTITGLEKALTLRQVKGRKETFASFQQFVLQQQYNHMRRPEELRRICELYTKSASQRAHLRAVLLQNEILLSES